MPYPPALRRNGAGNPLVHGQGQAWCLLVNLWMDGNRIRKCASGLDRPEIHVYAAGYVGLFDCGTALPRGRPNYHGIGDLYDNRDVAIVS